MRRFLFTLPATGWLLLSPLFFSACRTVAPAYTPTAARFFLETRPGDDGLPVTLPQSGVTIRVSPKPVFAEFDLVNVEIAQVELGKCLLFQFTPAAARDLERLTASSQGRRLVLSLNGLMLGARLIDRPFAEGTVLIFVELPDDRLPGLVQDLKRTSSDLQKKFSRGK